MVISALKVCPRQRCVHVRSADQLTVEAVDPRVRTVMRLVAASLQQRASAMNAHVVEDCEVPRSQIMR